MSQKVSYLPCDEFSLQLPALLLQSFNLLVFCQESTGLLCQVLGTLAGKCFFTQLQAGALQRHRSSDLHRREQQGRKPHVLVFVNHHPITATAIGQGALSRNTA